jgi:hypothetical protein
MPAWNAAHAPETVRLMPFPSIQASAVLPRWLMRCWVKKENAVADLLILETKDAAAEEMVFLISATLF